MNIIHYPILIIILPLLSAFLIPILALVSKKVKNWFFVSIFLLIFYLSVATFANISQNPISYHLGGWAPPFGIEIYCDSLSCFMLLIINGLAFLAALYSQGYLGEKRRRTQFYALFSLLVVGMNGIVLTADIFNMYVFLEILSISAYALVSFYRTRDALEASFKYMVQGSVASAFILLAIALIYGEYGTLNFFDIASKFAISKTSTLTLTFLFIGLASKSAILPLHFWLPDAHPSAPAPISMLLSGIMIKTTIYLMCRLFLTVFSINIVFSNLLLILGCLCAIVGVAMALVQHNLKRLLAYHSISQIGYILIGLGILTPMGVSGGLFHLLNHALFKSLLFLSAGALIYSTGSQDLDNLGGLAKKMPYLTVVTIIAAFSISGIPPTNGFVSKWMIYVASYKEYPIVTIIALLVSVGTLLSFAKVIHSIFFGRTNNAILARPIPLSMKIPMGIISILCIGIGIYPAPVQRIISTAVIALFGKSFVYTGLGSTFATALALSSIAIIVVFVIYLSTSYRRKEIKDHKHDTYLCGSGNTPENVPGSNLYFGVLEPLSSFYQILKREHSGNLQTYIFWIVISSVAVLAYIWRFFLV
ncbi:MAG: complex I subunit 5 family protein [Candidatus Methanofastidiosia archaeon]